MGPMARAEMKIPTCMGVKPSDSLDIHRGNRQVGTLHEILQEHHHRETAEQRPGRTRLTEYRNVLCRGHAQAAPVEMPAEFALSFYHSRAGLCHSEDLLAHVVLEPLAAHHAPLVHAASDQVRAGRTPTPGTTRWHPPRELPSLRRLPRARPGSLPGVRHRRAIPTVVSPGSSNGPMASRAACSRNQINDGRTQDGQLRILRNVDHVRRRHHESQLTRVAHLGLGFHRL